MISHYHGPSPAIYRSAHPTSKLLAININTNIDTTPHHSTPSPSPLPTLTLPTPHYCYYATVQEISTLPGRLTVCV